MTDPPSGEATPRPDHETRDLGPGRPASLRALGGLTAVQVFQLVAGLVTGPLLARALGAEGRGLLAAIAVPIGIMPFVAQIGLGSFAVNKVAQGTPPRAVLGTLMVPLLVVGCLVALASPFIAGVLAEGRFPVETFLIIGLATLPLAQMITLTQDVAWGLSRWRTMIVTRLVTPVVLLVSFATLFALGRLTVTTAAIVTLAGNTAPVVALVPVAWRLGRPTFHLSLLREGLRFGLRAWPGTLASLANLRLDQLLMIPLVPARELGLYAVATTIASLSGLLTSQVTTVVLPRISSGERWLIAPMVRSITLVVLATQTVIVAGTLLFLTPVFGAEFADARWIVMVLLVSALAHSQIPVLGQALPAIGRPGAPSVAEVVGLTITIPGLIFLLPSLGAMGAAIVSGAAYFVSLGVLLRAARNELDVRYTDLIVPRSSDLAFLVRRLGALANLLQRAARRSRPDS